MTEFIGSEAKQLYDDHRQTQESLSRANSEMDRVRTTEYEISAHGDSEYRQADHMQQIAAAGAQRSLDTAKYHIEDNLDFYVAEAKQDMQAAGKPYNSGVPTSPEQQVRIP